MGNPKVLIGLPTAEMARRADFYDYVNMLEKPEGCILMASHGQSPARNRNIIIEQAIAHNCTHVFFLDDDVAFPADTLKRLLAHDKDIVSGLYFMRSYPHAPILFDYAGPDGRCKTHYLQDGETGLIEAVGFGLGCCLIKIEVFKVFENPWITLGELEKDHWCDDLAFFRKVREKGYKLFCDLDIKVGHMAQLTVWPNYVDGKWVTTYDTNGTRSSSVHQLKEPENVPGPNYKVVGGSSRVSSNG